MADNETKPTTKEFATNDQANYYSRITSIKVLGKNAYELKGKFLDDLHNNAFSGTNGEDAVEHIEYILGIVDRIDLSNVNQDKLRVLVFPISLVGDAWKWFDEIKGPINSWVDLTKAVKIAIPPGIVFVFASSRSMVRVGCMTYFQDHKWYDELTDGKLKEEALTYKARIEESWGNATPGCCQETLILPVHVNAAITKVTNVGLKPREGEVELFGFVFLSYLKWLTTFGGNLFMLRNDVTKT
ncbi:hypothetical protein Tco_0603593 [Tanacetum coccineum]